jgi:CheY-like chemotaxis protein
MAKKINLVMLVDDNDTDNFISQKIIELNGFADRVIAKNSGKSALEYLEANENDPSALPEVIFLDINMPIVDGFVFLFEFERFNDELKKKCKIAILSSSDNKRDIERIVDNDYVVKYITKPLTQDALVEISSVL